MTRVKVNGEFGEWLFKKMGESNIAVYRLAEELRISPRIIYRHLKGECNPTLPYVIAYCWWFNERLSKTIDPMDIFYNFVERS